MSLGHGATGATLLVSIVLHRPDLSLLARTLYTLDVALDHAQASGYLAGARLRLTDHSPEPLKVRLLGTAWGRAIEYDFVGANPGFGAGHNRAFTQRGEAEYFLVANPDLECEPDSLSAGLDLLRQRPEIGLVAPMLIEEEGHLRPAIFRYPDLLTLALRQLGLAGLRNRRYLCLDDPAAWAAPEIVSGCCMLWRSTSFAALGGFDEGYFLYFEDFDLSWRASRLGLTACCPTMRLRHHGGGAGRKGLRHLLWLLRSAQRFFSRHGWRLA